MDYNPDLRLAKVLTDLFVGLFDFRQTSNENDVHLQGDQVLPSRFLDLGGVRGDQGKYFRGKFFKNESIILEIAAIS